MMKVLFRHIKTFIAKHTKKYVWALARMYDIRIEVPAYPNGRYPVIIEGGLEQIKHCIPSSVYFNTASGQIIVGEGTSFGYDVKLVTGKHMNLDESKKMGKNFHYVPDAGRDITIGKNCFFGTGAIIIGPVIIGDYTVVGAGAVVTKDLESKSFYVGNPARKIKSFE